MSNGVAYLITNQVIAVQGTAMYVITLIVEKRPYCIFVIIRDFFSKHCCKFLVICYKTILGGVVSGTFILYSDVFVLPANMHGMWPRIGLQGPQVLSARSVLT